MTDTNRTADENYEDAENNARGESPSRNAADKTRSGNDAPGEYCEGVRDDLVAFREGDLPRVRMTQLRIHLRHCAPCRERWLEYENLDSLVSSSSGSFVTNAFVPRTVGAMLGGERNNSAKANNSAKTNAAAKRNNSTAAWAAALSIAASLLVAAVWSLSPAPGHSPRLISPYEEFARDPGSLSSGRLLSSGVAGDLALPLPPTDRIGRAARYIASR
jgi:hypothetical protein